MSADVVQTEREAVPLRTGWRKAVPAVAWMALAVLGQQAAIDLYEPGAWKFGFRSPDESGQHFLALTVTLVVATVAIARIARLYIRPAHWDGRRVIGITGSAAVWIVATTLLSRSPGAYGVHLGLTTLTHVAGLACVVLAIQALPPGFALRSEFVNEERYAWRAVLAGAIFATVASAILAWAVFRRIPHVPDEVAYLFQARSYAHGSAFLTPPPAPELFRQFLTMVYDGKWFGVFPPGWPLVLAIGVLIGLPWLVNPVLAGLGVVLVYRVIRRMHSSATAVLTALLVATSPLYVTIGATYMAHSLSIVCALVALLATIELQRGSGIRWAFSGGAALGLLFLARPIEGVSVGIVILAMCAGALGRRVRGHAVAVAVATGSMVGSVFFLNNRLLTGSALRDPVQLFFDRTFYPGADQLGFGPNKGNLGWANDIFPGHSPLEAAIHVNLNLSIIDTELFGWLGGALLFVVILALGRRVRGVALWVCMIIAIVIPTTLYWYSGADLGPRYWYQTLVPFAALTALGVNALADRIGVEQRRAATVVLILAVFGFFQITTWRARDKYQNYRGVSAHLGDLIRNHDMQHGLIFVRNGSKPNDYADYASGFIWNTLPLGNGPIVARYGSVDAMTDLHSRFPDRKVWVVAPSGDDGEYDILTPASGAILGGQ